MKSQLKTVARNLWRISAPITRPVIRKFDNHMMRLLGSASPRCDTPANLDLVLNSVVRELGRLQSQVEILHHQIEDLQSRDRTGDRPENRLSVVGEIG